MKHSILSRIALLVCALGVAGFTSVSAQDTTNTYSTGGFSGHRDFHHHGGGLTKEERQELKTDREQVLSSNPDLAAEGKALEKAMYEHKKKIEEAMEQIDPNAAALIAKLKGGHHFHHHKPGSDSDSNSNTDSTNDSGS